MVRPLTIIIYVPSNLCGHLPCAVGSRGHRQSMREAEWAPKRVQSCQAKREFFCSECQVFGYGGCFWRSHGRVIVILKRGKVLTVSCESQDS